jgi:hypothetical protein
MIFRPYFVKTALVLVHVVFLFLGVKGQGKDSGAGGRKVDTLKAATVVGKRPIVEAGIDRLRFNVAGTDLVKGNTLWGLIEKTPLVTAGENGSIQIAGTTGAVVYINNKRKVLTGEALKTWLAAMPADNVEAIEVITTPSSKYEAEGGAGILNIVLKRNKQEGFDGSLALSNRETALNSQSGSVFLNDCSGKWDVYSTTYGVNRRRKPTARQDFSFGSSGESSDIALTNHNQAVSAGTNLGIDYQATPNQVVGMLFDYSGDWNNNTRDADTYSGDSVAYSNNRDKINAHTYSLNLNYDGKLDPTGKRLSVDVDALRYVSSYRSTSRTAVLDRVDDYFRSSSPQDVSNQSVKVDFKWPFSKRVTLETGAKLSFSQINDNLVFENNGGGNAWVKDESRSNVFRYNEDIVAAYAVLNHTVNSSWAYQVGTRLEHTSARGWLDDIKAVNQNYLNAFPTGFLKFSPASKAIYVLAVSSRITRPSYWDVNPFRTYTNDATYWEGNPFLSPSRYYREELRRTMNVGKASYTFMAAATQTLGEIYALPHNDTGNVVVFKKINYGNRYSYTGAFVFAEAFRPWWQFSGTVLSGYIRTIGNYADVVINNKTFLLTLSTNQSFTLSRKNGLSCTVIANNSLPYTIVNTRVGDRFDTELRIRKTSGPFNFTLSVTDIFKTNRDNYVVHNGDLTALEEFYNDTRSVALTMNYAFGKASVKKNRDRDTQFQDVKDRIM